MAFMVDEIRCELNGVEINRNRNVGITSSIKNYISLTYDKALIMRNAGWNIAATIPEIYLNFCIPLNTLLGLCEDHKRVIVNLARHELILIRARSNNNCLVGNPTTEPEIGLFKVQWQMPRYIKEVNKLLATSFGKRAIFSIIKYEFPFMGSVRVPPVAEHDQIFVGH